MVVRPILSKLKASENRDTWAWRIVEVTQPYMVEALTCAARFLKYDARAKGFVPTDAPDKIAKTYLHRQGSWKLPILSGITNAPFLRDDGSVCEQTGYDPASGILFKLEGESFPPIPQNPARADALEALAVIERLIATFPFIMDADRSVALSAILTALDRRSMATAPLHAFTAPLAGTGKSLLVDVIAILAIGRLMPVIAQGRSEEELEKRLGAALLHGDQLVSIDNCDHLLQSSFLCQALTQQRVNIRLLGLSRNVETPVNAAIFATGNNLTIAGDLNRRTLLCSLDARCEHPEQRKFVGNLVQHVRENRGRLVAATLTVLRAWHVSGQMLDTGKLLGSFEDWSRRVRGPLAWLGRVDPCETILKVKDNDPGRLALSTVLAQWKEYLDIGGAYTVQEVINRAANVADFHTALINVAGGRSNALVNNARLGRWLRKIEGQIVGDLMLHQVGNRHGYPLWSLMQIP
jgi:putative DNA primase/helicase